MASKAALGSRTTSLSSKLRQLGTHIPGLGDRHHQQQQEQQQQESEKPGFQITHTPDRPNRPVYPSEAPSEEVCEAEISAWRRRARGDSLAMVGNTARERRRIQRLRGTPKLGLEGDDGIFVGAGEGSDSGNEDMVVEDYEDGGDGSKEDEYAPSLSRLTTIAQDERRGSLRIAIPETHSNHRLPTLVEKSRSPSGVGPSSQPQASPRSPLDRGEGGLQAGRYGSLLSPPSIRASAGYSSDGSEAYNGEVVEAERVDVQRLYELESARRGYCLRCRARTITKGTVSCTSCVIDFGRAFGEDFYSQSPQEEQRQPRPESSSPPTHQPRRRRSDKPGPSPLSREAAFSDARLAALKPLMQLHDTAPAVRLDATPGVERFVPEGEISPIKAVFDPPPLELANYASTTNRGAQHVSPRELHIAMMQVSPIRMVRNSLARRGMAPKGQEILRADEVRSIVPVIDEATKMPERDPPASRNAVSKFHRPIPAREAKVVDEGARGSSAWELDLVSSYEKDSPSEHHDEWI